MSSNKQKKSNDVKLVAHFAAIVIAGAVGIFLGFPNYWMKIDYASRQSQAKASLAALFTAEKDYFAGHKTYTPCLDQLDFQHIGNYEYAVGFRKTAGDNCKITGYAANIRRSRVGPPLPTLEDLPSESAADVKHFKAYAVGSIGGVKLDVWSIDDLRVLKNEQDGQNPPAKPPLLDKLFDDFYPLFLQVVWAVICLSPTAILIYKLKRA